MKKLSATLISNLFLNLFWFIVFSAKAIFSDVKKTAIFILCVMTAVFLSVSVWAVAFRVTEPEITYNFVKKEQNAVSVQKESADRVYLADGEKTEIIYDNNILVNTLSSKVDMLFGLPQGFSYDAVVTIERAGCEIAKSGRITEGQKIEQLPLVIGFDDMYLLNEDTAEMIVDFYDSKTGQMLEKRLIIEVFMESEEGDWYEN